MILLSLGSGHTNVWLRQCRNQVRSLFPPLATEAGKLDPQKVGLGQPDFNTALEGLEWFVLHWQLEDIIPGFFDWAQKSLNAQAASDRGETEIMKELWESAVSMGYPASPVVWKDLEDTISQSLAPCTKYIKVMSNFLKAYGGPFSRRFSKP